MVRLSSGTGKPDWVVAAIAHLVELVDRALGHWKAQIKVGGYTVFLQTPSCMKIFSLPCFEGVTAVIGWAGCWSFLSVLFIQEDFDPLYFRCMSEYHHQVCHR